MDMNAAYQEVGSFGTAATLCSPTQDRQAAVGQGSSGRTSLGRPRARCGGEPGRAGRWGGFYGTAPIVSVHSANGAIVLRLSPSTRSSPCAGRSASNTSASRSKRFYRQPERRWDPTELLRALLVAEVQAGTAAPSSCADDALTSQPARSLTPGSSDAHPSRLTRSAPCVPSSGSAAGRTWS